MKLIQYFYRCAVFSRQDGNVALADVHMLNDRTQLDEWLGTVLSLADGQHTINELIDYMRSRYDQPPENLEETLSSVLERLIHSKLVVLSDVPVQLPYYLASPIEELDLEKAKRLMTEDGYVYH